MKTSDVQDGGPSLNMVTYEFYWRDPIKGYQLFGVLPERRRNPARITEGSLINWVKKYFGQTLDINEVLFVQISTDESTGKIFRRNPFFLTQEKT